MTSEEKVKRIKDEMAKMEKEIADIAVSRDYWDGWCKVFNAIERILKDGEKEKS